jgi:hypothetical protein
MSDNTTDNMIKAEESIGISADTYVNLLDEPKTPSSREGGREYQRHVAIEWEGGVIWLNLFDFVNYEDAQSPHFCIDIRQFNSAGKVKGQGVFTMARSMIGRGAIAFEGEADHLRKLMAQALERCQVADDRSGAADEAAAILSSAVNLDGSSVHDRSMPQGHGWDGGFLVSILTDPDGQETHTDDEREW